MRSVLGALSATTDPQSHTLRAATSAVSVTLPHAVGLGLLAFSPLAGQADVAALALWACALPMAVLALGAPRPGVVHAPSTVVALMFASVLTVVQSAAATLGLGPPQMLAVAGATMALGLCFQWLFGRLQLASLARFLPVPVAHGFAAGLGLTMVASQLRTGFGAGRWNSGDILAHAAVALGVVGLAVLLRRRWPRLPVVLLAVAGMAALLQVSGLAAGLQPAAAIAGFGLPVLPDVLGVPWLSVLREEGTHLATLAFLMAVVNSLDVVVFNQELEVEHGVRGDPDAALRRESLLGMACALLGMIPASTSASRSRLALGQGGRNVETDRLHALFFLGVALSGPLWLPLLPMACLSGGLLLAGFSQVPAALWSRAYAHRAPVVWGQSWLVAIVFALTGGAGALLAGLVVATFVLLHASASTALRAALLDGQLRSRRLRSSAAEAWLAPRMATVAVLELQGVLSFGVAAHLARQVQSILQDRHVRVVLDASRVPAWDATAVARVLLLVRDLRHAGREAVLSGVEPRARAQLEGTATLFPDLDRALEWAEDALLLDRPEATQVMRVADPDDPQQLLGDLAAGLEPVALGELVQSMEAIRLEAGQVLFAAGDADADLVVVRMGRISMATAWPPSQGLRLATVGPGMAFGEMAFLSGQPRTAHAGAETQPAQLARLSRAAFDAWAARHPQDGLRFMANLAEVGTRRLAATSRQLRAVLESASSKGLPYVKLCRGGGS